MVQNLKKYIILLLKVKCNFFNKKDKKKIIRDIIFGASIAMFVFSMYKIFTVQVDYYLGNREYATLQKRLENNNRSSNEQVNTDISTEIIKSESSSTTTTGTLLSTTPASTILPTLKPTPKPKLLAYTDKKTSDFKILSNINKDVIGWIYINNTRISYPIVQAKDNEFYLNRTFEGNTRKCGSIFLDYRNDNDFKSRNAIIYGHNMKNGTMFHDLRYFKDGKKNIPSRFIRINLPNGNLTYEIFSIYITDVAFDYLKVNFKNDEEYMNYNKEIIKKSLMKSKITPVKTDKIITLSTCSYEFDNARLVVHARLINQD